MEELDIIIRYHILISMLRLEIHTRLAGNGATKMKRESSKFAIISLALVVNQIAFNLYASEHYL